MAFHPEIERVWLLAGLPVMPEPLAILTITQGYVRSSIAKEAGLGPKFRLRKSVGQDGTASWTQTRKTGQGMVREEEERPLTLDEFEAMWPLTEGRRIKKTRFCIAAAGDEGVWEVDEFHGLDLAMAEIELQTPSREVSIPHWLNSVIVTEVTEDGRYRNSSLARDGLPT
jgi:CYTH domain-containing protein